MDTGKLRHRIELYTVTTTADGQGGTTPTYTLASTRYAAVKQLTQAESMRDGMVVGERNYRITMRRGTDEELSRSIQIRWNGRRLNVTSIVTDEFWFYLNASDRA